MQSSSLGLNVDVKITRSGTLCAVGFDSALADVPHSDKESEEHDEGGGGEAALISGNEEGGVGGVGSEGEAEVDADGGGDVDVEDVNEEVEDAFERRWWVCV